MNNMENEIENLLRAAPKPAPPVTLKEQLTAQIRLPVLRATASPLPSPLGPANWIRRWWPVLVPAAASLACAVGLTVQQAEIQSLKQAIRDLSRDGAPKPSVVPGPASGTNADAPAAAGAEDRTQQEVTRLKGLASQLATEVSELEQLRGENSKLRSQLSQPPPGFLTQEETDALAAAKAKAESIQCINNLKQMELSVRVWAIDNDGSSPPDMLSMSNELSTPKILVCPADKTREPAKGWASFSPAYVSYDYLGPSAPDTEPNRVMFRCPIHGHVCLSDGSVQGYVAKEHPERLVQRDGKLYLGDPPAPAQAVRPSNMSDAEKRFRARYGLDARQGAAPTPQPPQPDGSNQ